MHGRKIRHLVENLQQEVREKGRPVIVDNKGTIELINCNFTLSYTEPIKIVDIEIDMKRYYFENNLNIDELQELEKDEYSKIANRLYDKFKFFDNDINSRRVLWTDDCCISMVQYIVRDNTILCFVNFRSSDVVNKLFSDLFLIHTITRKLQDKLKINKVIINVNAHSLHEIVINRVNKSV